MQRPQHQAGDVLGAVGDLVLYTQQIKQIGARHRQEQALGQVLAYALLQFVGLVLQLRHLLLDLLDLFPVLGLTAWNSGTRFAAHSCDLAICCCIGPIGERPNKLTKGLTGIGYGPGLKEAASIRTGHHACYRASSGCNINTS
nr:hypothetical protein [Acinetobacter baumannii]